MLQSMGSQRIGHDWATEQQQQQIIRLASLLALKVKNQPETNDPGSIPGSGRSPEEGNGYLLQCSYLKKPMDRGTWQARVHGITESDTAE